MWAHCELVFPGFCSLAAFPGGLLCRFGESEQQWPNLSLSEQRDHGPFTDVLATFTLFLLVLLNPVVSRDVRPTPGVPAFTSRAGVSLSLCF